MANEAAIKRIYCNRCKSTTRHVSKGRYIHKWESPDGDIQGEIEYCLLICAGCEDGSLEVTECDSEGFLGDGTPEYRTSYLPKRGRDELIPKTFRKLPGSLTQIYGETIDCFNSGSLILATVGLRALLDGICENKKISGKNLSQKIGNLGQLLPNTNIIDALHHFRFTGNRGRTQS